MSPLWNLCPSLESLQYFLELEDQEPPGFELVNRDALVRHWDRFLRGEFDDHTEDEREVLEFDTMPTPVFRIADPAFALDYFQKGRLHCASKRLRQALGLTDDVIRYRDIDLDQSPPEVRARAYQAFHVVRFADLIDWTRTTTQTIELPRPDGSIRKQRFLAHPLELVIFWRDDITPLVPLFRVTGTPWMLASDGLAERVMGAGVVDLVFQDIMSECA